MTVAMKLFPYAYVPITTQTIVNYIIGCIKHPIDGCLIRTTHILTDVLSNLEFYPFIGTVPNIDVTFDRLAAVKLDPRILARRVNSYVKFANFAVGEKIKDLAEFAHVLEGVPERDKSPEGTHGTGGVSDGTSICFDQEFMKKSDKAEFIATFKKLLDDEVLIVKNYISYLERYYTSAVKKLNEIDSKLLQFH
jgi:hypothetical protein